MADTKRQNAAGKVPVATPNIGNSGMVSQEAALSGVIGARIRLTTNIPSQPTVEGNLFTVCPFTSLLAIATPPPNSVHHVIPISSIQSFNIHSTTAFSTPAPFANATPPIAPLPSALLLDRANAAVARLQEAAARKNKSVSKDGQEIFDALSRTLPTMWDGTNIVVMDAVVITSPYRGEDCKAKAGAGQQAGVLPRVKKVLENERKRLADRSTKVVPVVPAMPAVLAGGPRKGG
ncbi:hypothetical protein MMC07_007471 [Pseudocyphellaria aurata]|nr:hypothetical protein [Pseudocyphellaria aurata]